MTGSSPKILLSAMLLHQGAALVLLLYHVPAQAKPPAPRRVPALLLSPHQSRGAQAGLKAQRAVANKARGSS